MPLAFRVTFDVGMMIASGLKPNNPSENLVRYKSNLIIRKQKLQMAKRRLGRCAQPYGSRQALKLAGSGRIQIKYETDLIVNNHQISI